MPRRPKDGQPENPNPSTEPMETQGEPEIDPSESPENSEQDGDDLILAEGNEPPDGVLVPVSANTKDPKPSRAQKESRAMAEGTLPNIKIMVKRLSPDRVINPATGLAVKCEGQFKTWKGQFTREEIEEMVANYFGGGTMRCVQQNDDTTNMKEFGRMLGRFNVTFPGEPNMQYVLADCMTSPVLPNAPSTGAPAPQLPDDPAAKILRETAVMDASRRMMDKETEIEEAKIENERKRRAMRRRAEFQRQEEEAGSGEGAFTFEGPPGSRMPVPFRPGVGGFNRHMPPVPFNEMDAPVSLKDSIHQRELDAAREETRRLADRMERMLEHENRKPKTDLKELLVALGAVVAPVIVKMLDISNQNQAAARESQNQFNKAMADSSNKQIELFTNVVGIRDKRDSASIEQMIKFIELGKDMGGSDDDGGGTVIEQIGRAGGDLIGGIVSALQNKNQAPAQVPVHPPAAPPIIARPVPQPGASLPAHPQAALPPPPPPAINPMQQVRSSPAAQQVRTAEQQQAGEEIVDDRKLKAIARAVVQAALDEVDAKPEEAKWVLVAFKNLPDNWIEAIANAEHYADLTEMAKPFAPLDLLIFKFKPKFDGDPAVKPWLEAGWAELREMCQEEMKSQGSPGVVSASPAAKPGVAEGRSAEDAETEFGG